ncbi:MAG: HD domain-containing phosphohydrolase, partial [Parvibaculum sp.]|nr:HD domain-containing phosphohydrolase [Parvibaculum sp.]
IDNLSNILLCENSALDVAYISKQLQADGYTQIRIVSDPWQVMPLLEKESFDLLLLDTEMSYVDGLELTRQIRQRFSEAELPILVTTAMPTGKTRNLTQYAGGNDYLGMRVDQHEASLQVKNLITIRNLYKSRLAIESSLEREVAARTTKLDMLIENGLMMSMERDRSKLLQHILVEGQRLLHCDGATMYLVTEQKTLRFALRTKDDSLPSIEIPLYDEETGNPNERYVSTYVAAHNKPILIDDVYQETRFDLSGTRRFDADSHYLTVSMLTVPMAPRNGEVIGVLQFMNALEPGTGAIVPFSTDMLVLVKALAGQAAVALDNLQLVEAQKALVDNMIQVIATAIDAKSPYTGRHCSRVPELAVMLAETVSETVSGPLADFRFNSEDEWREFRIGAWLHDCGKVTTPEYVIDKATKLETIHNRIHEVRMRFEVLLRDAEIERLTALSNGENPEAVKVRHETSKARLLDDFAFIAECNIGTETMTDDRIERLNRIAGTTWLRHFDDRLGLSDADTARCQSEPASCLPAVEKLLANKPRHLIAREKSELPDSRFGFKMDVPAHLYNHGEIYNLCIRRGTLTEEERYKINEHMVFTIMMLEQMHFPKSLKRVPEYAGTHHEGLNGRGYPRRLSAKDLSIPARIMAIADVFEALTAPDRPYKKPNKVSEAVKILYGLKKSRHIDADIFDLFLTSGLYLRYAEKYLKPEQIDSVDLLSYIGTVSA